MAQFEYVKSLGATYIRSATFIKKFTVVLITQTNLYKLNLKRIEFVGVLTNGNLLGLQSKVLIRCLLKLMFSILINLHPPKHSYVQFFCESDFVHNLEFATSYHSSTFT